MTSAPTIVRRSAGLMSRLLRSGLPMGPNVILTVRGRTSGQPRSAPVAVVEIDGQRWIMGAYGDVQWVRNLRAAGVADIEEHGRTEHVTASELDPAAAQDFFGRILPGYIGRFPWVGRSFAGVLFGRVAPEILGDPARAAVTRPVFELRSAAAAERG